MLIDCDLNIDTIELKNTYPAILPRLTVTDKLLVELQSASKDIDEAVFPNNFASGIPNLSGEPVFYSLKIVKPAKIQEKRTGRTRRREATNITPRRAAAAACQLSSTNLCCGPHEVSGFHNGTGVQPETPVARARSP